MIGLRSCENRVARKRPHQAPPLGDIVGRGLISIQMQVAKKNTDQCKWPACWAFTDGYSGDWL